MNLENYKHMSTNGKIRLMRTTKNVFDSAKDSTVSSIISMVNEGKIKMDRQNMTKLVGLINNMMDESFQRGSKSIEREVDYVLETDVTKKN